MAPTLFLTLGILLVPLAAPAQGTEVSNLPADEVQAHTVRIGSVVAQSGEDVPRVTIYYGTSDGGRDAGGWEGLVEMGRQFGSARTTLEGLTGATTYYFRARAGTSWAATSGMFTTLAPHVPVVANQPATGLTGTTAVLRGEVRQNGNDDPRITIYYGPTDGGTDPAEWAEARSLGPDGGEFSVFVSGLTEETTYYFRSHAANAAGEAWAAGSGSFKTTDDARPPVVINEIHYDENDKTLHVEFVELHNTSGEVRDLSGWRLSSAVDFRIPEGTEIAPGGFLVIARKPAAVLARWGVSSLGPWTGRLDNEGEVIRLRDTRDVVVDEVDYRNGFPWPTVGAAPSASIELLNPGLENDLGGSWRASTGEGGNGENILAAGGSSWRFFKGREEPSPGGAWRAPGFDDENWAIGDGTVGYGQGFVDTTLEDMAGGYSTVYLRKAFRVEDPDAIGALLLQARADDGFNAWINGTHIASHNVSGRELPFGSLATASSTGSAFEDYAIPNSGGLLVEGENVLAVQLLNRTLNDSDAFFDAALLANVQSGTGPTPGFANSVFTTEVPPQIRRVEHLPAMPRSGEDVLISALVTDPDTVASVVLEYQLVRPGRYVRLSDPDYERGWASLPMNDAGTEGDLHAGDNTWSVSIPGALQRHRYLVRYRIRVEDGEASQVRVPYSDDPSPNFAYFCYDGVPPWSGALHSGARVVNYSSDTLTRVPVYHMIVQENDLIGCMYTDSLGLAKTYRYLATVVYDGIVYDHIRFRVKGQASTRVTGKNKVKWNFNRGHRFQARDNYGRKYPVKWDKFALQTGTCPWWAFDSSTGGMVLNEHGAYRMYRLLGVPSCNTHLFHLRVIDNSREVGRTQYEGDFWGLYIALGEPDGRFLAEMGLPDGNLYKMNGSPNKRNQGPTQDSGTADVNSFISRKNSANSRAFWQRTVNLPRYYDYKIGTTLINNTDLRAEWNCLYYSRPRRPGDPNSGKWEMFPWDLDLTWESKNHWRAESVWENWQRVLVYPEERREFQNRAREVWDLMCSSGDGAKMVEEMKRFLDGDGTTRIVEANQALWDHHPRKTKKGIWYRNNPGLGPAEQNWEGLVRYMKEFVSPGGYGADRLLNEKAESGVALPAKPVLTALGAPLFPTDDLRFRSSAFRGGGRFEAMEWRLAEITDPGSANFDPTEPWVYEITPLWESGELGTFQSEIAIPPVVRVGHTYRVRVRHLGSAGHWSHWSDPLEFVASPPDVSAYVESLVVTELMYNPAQATAAEVMAGFSTGDFEFIEIKNIGNTSLDLTGVRFTKGVDFDFEGSAITTLAPGAIALVVRNEDAFEMRYGAGLPVAGEFMPDNFSNSNENVKLSFGAGVAIQEFHYSDGPPWPAAPDGEGFSLQLRDPGSAPDHSLPENWAASITLGGSPGTDEARRTIGDWKRERFSVAELADPAISGDLADGDGDGLSTLMEYALGADPHRPDAYLLPGVVSVLEDGEHYPGMRFRRSSGAGDLDYVIETSGNLIDWLPAAGRVLVEKRDNGDGSITETHRLPTAFSASEELFLRLRVSLR